MSILTDQQKASLINSMTAGGVKRTSVDGFTVDRQVPTQTEAMNLLKMDASCAAIKARKRPFLLQVHKSPGAVYDGHR